MTLIVYYSLLNIFAWILMGIDKKRAIKNKWRISENMLMSLSILGGCVGTLIGMVTFKHKLSKKKFTITIPLFIVFHWILTILKILYG